MKDDFFLALVVVTPCRRPTRCNMRLKRVKTMRRMVKEVNWILQKVSVRIEESWLKGSEERRLFGRRLFGRKGCYTVFTTGFVAVRVRSVLKQCEGGLSKWMERCREYWRGLNCSKQSSPEEDVVEQLQRYDGCAASRVCLKLRNG